MLDQKRLLCRRSTSALFCCLWIICGCLFAGGAVAATETELQQQRKTLQVYERRIPSLLTEMSSLDRRLEALQQQRDSVEQNLNELTRTYLIRQRAHEQAQAAAAASNDRRAKAALEHSRFQYYLVERKLTNLQTEAEQLDEDMAPLKQSLRDRQRQLRQSEKKVAEQKEYVRKLATAAPTTPERIEIKSRNKTAAAQPALQVSPAVTVPSVSARTPIVDNSNRKTVETKNQNSAATTEEERRYASAQAKRLQALLANGEASKPAGGQTRTLEVQHKGKPGVKHYYDLAYIGANHYTTEGTVHSGKQVFKVAKQRWITTIPDHDDGANYVFVLTAMPHRRLELIMYNAALVERQPDKTALREK